LPVLSRSHSAVQYLTWNPVTMLGINTIVIKKQVCSYNTRRLAGQSINNAINNICLEECTKLTQVEPELDMGPFLLTQPNPIQSLNKPMWY